jgi:hypothetical protein
MSLTVKGPLPQSDRENASTQSCFDENEPPVAGLPRLALEVARLAASAYGPEAGTTVPIQYPVRETFAEFRSRVVGSRALWGGKRS